MARFRESDIAQLRESLDIVAIVSDHLPLKAAGGGSHKGLCPFHTEKTPSFNVRPAYGTYHCFGCGASGDGIEFIMQVMHLTFPDAVEHLAETHSLTLHREDTDAAAEQQRRRIIEANQAALAYFADQLRNTDEAAIAREYLTDRHFTVDDAIDEYDCGYAPQRSKTLLLNHLRQHGFTVDELTQAGLIRNHHGRAYDRFRGRILWAIRDITGRPIGFGARRLHLDDPLQAKYLNTDETCVYRKSQVLYGLDRARQAIANQRQAVIVEGYTDVMAYRAAGVDNVVASSGTAFGAEHLNVIRRLIGEGGEIVYAVDGDEAGQKAALKNYDTASRSVRRLSTFLFPHGQDPEEYRRAHGNTALFATLENRKPLVGAVIDSILAARELATPEDRMEALDALCPAFAHIEDSLLFDQYARDVAGTLALPHQDVAARLRPRAATTTPQAVSVAPPATRQAAWLEKEILRVVMHAPEQLDRIRGALTADLFQHPAALAVLNLIKNTPYAPDSDVPWGRQVLSQAADNQRGAITALVVDPLEIADENVGSYADEVLARLRVAELDRRIAEARHRLRTVSEDCQVAVLEEVAGLRKQREEVRATVSARPHP